MADHPFEISITNLRDWFKRATACFEEKDSAFAPTPEMFTVAQQVAHAAVVIDWFFEGAFSPKGLSGDFEAMDREVRKIKSLAEARAWFERSCQSALEKTASVSMADLHQSIGPGAVMAGCPRIAIFEALADHTAHHRGALTVYARLLGKVPPMPYM